MACDPAQLLESAKCIITCIPPGIMPSARLAALCRIANALWTPASEPNLLAWYRGDRGVNKTGVVLDTWEDQSGNGLTLGNSANRPEVVTNGVVSGINAIQFDGVNDFLKTAVATMNQPLTIYLMLKQITWSNGDRVYSGLTDGFLFQNASTPLLFMRTGASTGPSKSVPLSEWVAMTNLWNDTLSKNQVNNGVEQGGTPGAGNFGGLTLGATPFPALFSNVSFGELIVRSGSDDALTRFRHVTWLQRRIGVTYYNVICEGDSLTAGAGLGAAVLFPNEFCILRGVIPWGFQILAVGGSVVADLVARAPNTDLYVDIGTAMNLLTVWIGTNDIANSSAPATVLSAISSYCLLRKAAGWRVAIFTILPRNGTANANFEADRQSLNTLIRSSYTTFADVLVDVGADATIGEPGDQNNLTYYLDGTHLTAAGHDVVAAILNAVV